MTKISRALACSLVVCCALLLSGLQTANADLERELNAGKLAVEQGDLQDAIAHFTRANRLQQNKCSECYVWLARIQMASQDLDEALKLTMQASALASDAEQRASAELYRGVVLGRQGNLLSAESAFKAAIAANPECVECRFNLGFVLLEQSKDAEGVQELKLVAPHFAGSARGREIERFIADPSRVRKDFAPEFAARGSNGEEINLDTLKGKVVLLDFWGTWCAPCRVSLPLLKDLAAKVDPAKVAIVSIDENDSREKWANFIQENGMKWIQVYDGDRSLYQAFHVDGFPRYYILNKNGIIVARFKGWAEGGEAAISRAIAEALGPS